MDELCSRFKITVKHSRPRHPQSQGQVERLNQTITRYLQKFVFEEEKHLSIDESLKVWKKHLAQVVYDYNLATHSATKKTPFRLFLQIPGFNTVLTPDNVKSDVDVAEPNTEVVTRESSILPQCLKRMDKHASVHNSKYDFTAIVSKSFDNNSETTKLKLSSFFSKEVKITEILSKDIVKIENGEEIEVISMSRIKKN
ncbi:Transposon Tf2-6 polyprotein [Nosema granulosis]|uniref:Transposon Tf2-6 polyprotein n=1 Tax=Nosema granulosis TaxID=83296 RepID=A0A9P6GY65_9MICR|nr:Transposon Tf2-6 polyprotein [Nosema granulosis]